MVLHMFWSQLAAVGTVRTGFPPPRTPRGSNQPREYGERRGRALGDGATAAEAVPTASVLRYPIM